MYDFWVYTFKVPCVMGFKVLTCDDSGKAW